MSDAVVGPPLSSLLLALADTGEDRISIAEIISHFGRRAFGAALFALALLNLLPSPPGASTVLGLPLLILGPQLAFGAKTLWLPGFVGDRTVRRRPLIRACQRAARWVQRAEGLTRPRLRFMFSAPGELLIGMVCTLLALVLVLPIPLGNMLPAASIAVLALSLMQRDGLLATFGYLLAAASAGVLLLSAQLVFFAIDRLAILLGLS